jgi:hypothetical protein
MGYTALISGLIGALIGALSSLLAQIVQNAYQNRRESTRLLFETAYKDYELRIEHLPENIGPFPVILDYHQQMMSLIEKGQLTPDSVKRVFRRQAEMTVAVHQVVAESRQGAGDQSESQT